MFRSISIKVLLVVFAMAGSLAANAQHQHHAKHNMLLFGTEEVFADHIVYKDPHNYQVILRVNFDSDVKQAYLNAKENYPNDTFILLLDSMDIGKIGEAERISGTLLRRNSSGQEETIKANVTLGKEYFKVLYFDELPLSLAKDAPTSHSPSKEVLMNNNRVSGLLDVSNAENSCNTICRPITMGSDSCQAYCRVGEIPVCRTHGQGAGCIAECFCRGRL